MLVKYVGIVVVNLNFNQFITDWIKPFGTIFINLLKLIAVPIVFVSLIKGISSLNDIAKLSKIGFRSILLYLSSTFLAVNIGLILANVINPGETLLIVCLQISFKSIFSVDCFREIKNS